MKVILAEKAGFCFGVKRAVDEAIKAKEEYNKRIYTLGPLIHNNDVVKFLEENDIFSVDENSINELKNGDVIIIRSHGVSAETFKKLEVMGLNIINATCPYVSNIQLKVKEYYDKGYAIVIVGDKKHPEVIGINGWCNNTAIIAKTKEELGNLPRKVCVVSQTTEKQENWENVIEYILKTCREIMAFNTICNATEERQKSVEELSKKVDMMVVLGGYNSSNTTKLYEICKKNCSNTIHVENWKEVPKEYFLGKNINTIGVTAGASTPDWIIKEAIKKMSEMNNEVNEQLAFMQQNENHIYVGKVVKGTIISVNEKEAYVNLGYKSDGLLPKEEVTKESNVSLLDILKAGEEVEVKVINRNNSDGYVILSKTEIEREQSFKDVKQAFEDGSSLKVVVKSAVTGGLIGSYKGVRIFIPASHIELFHVDNLEHFIGKEIDIKIIELKTERRNTRIVGSRRDILKAERNIIEEEAWKTINVGDKLVGEVKRLTQFGAFVEVSGIDGLLHVSEISWGKVDKPSSVLKVGQKVEVLVVDANKEEKKLSLSIKKLTENPWENVEEKYPVGTIVLGKVVRFANFGAFVELEPGVDALVHISQISHNRINKPSDALKIGEQIKAKIVDVDKETRKIGLSIKEAEEV
ncbi:bifunctional 4-hydroxy-3-methylbut-2-enyl diphosphate reductase/30S ribosomal protein S1 [Candidatus Clostridium stratigraminis]|uniref:4-hydroxy-3-methylbut-2-enyl diphosphate reductase n=1 Tax=Candidatus Clostridium stratigraminis TaxID=3381661 RepID=A0ABW8T3X8_9CLOT